MKRLVSLALSMLLLLSLLALPAAAEEKKGLSEFAGLDPIDVTLSMWNFTTPNGEYAGEKFLKKVRDEFGINLVCVPVTWADSNDKIRMFAASDSLPDVFVHLGWDAKYDFKDFVDQELVRSIPENLYSKYENVNRVMTTYSYEAMPDGEMYHLPREDRAWQETNGNPIGLYYRKDYAEKLGYTQEQLSKPMTIDELTVFLEKMALNDPDNNGQADTYGLGNALDTGTGLGFMSQLIYPMFGWRPWVCADGQWQYGYISDVSKEATRWLHDLYNRGILDPEFAILKDSQMIEKFCTGKLGVAPYNMNNTNAKYLRTSFFEKINPDQNIADNIGALPLPTREDGTRNSRPKAYWSATLISYMVDDQKLDRILAMFDWLYSVDGYTFAYWGEENVDYKVENGVLTSLCKDAAGNAKAFASGTSIALMQNMAGWHLDAIPGIVDASLTDWDQTMDKTLVSEYWPYSYPNNFVTYLFTPAVMAFDIETYVENQLVTIIMQSKDFDADWDKFVNDLFDNYNLAAVTEEVNNAAIEKGIEWVPYKK